MKKLLPSQGIALITVLAFLAIISVLLVTFMTVVRLERSASRNYSQSLKAEQLAVGAVELIVSDLRREIIAGSTAATPFANPAIPGASISVPQTNKPILPARYGDNSSPAEPEPNLIRRSLADSAQVQAAFPSSVYTTTNLPPVVASPVSSATASANGRSISIARWNKPRLLKFPDRFLSPDWIYVTRNGPKAFASYSTDLANRASADFVLGRYAYTIYDQGGLLDINLAGHPDTVDARVVGSKSFVGYADTTAIPGINDTIAKALVDWRNQWSGASYAGNFANAGEQTGYTSVQGNGTGSDNTFLGRQDLIDYATRNGFADSLRFLGTHSRELNSPSLAAGANATLNPEFSRLFRNNKPIRRFPLSHFGLLQTDPSTATPAELAEIERLFGLTPATGASASNRKWVYRSATIGTPQDAITANRDPDLFELLKAAIVNGSLGAKAANSGLISSGSGDYAPEANVHHQVARIIANLADQYDSDNYPTTITMGTNDVYGIESLPYFSEMFFKAHFPSGFSGGTGALYTYFELWNPHQGPIPASGPSQVRIRANSGARVTMNYIQIGSPGGPGNPNGSYSRVNTSLPELPPSAPFPTTSIVATNLAQFQTGPAVVDNPSDAATRISALTPAVNGWTLLTVNRPIPATWTGSKFTSLAISSLVPVLEFEDANGNWNPYSTFAGHFTAAGTTGIQEAGRPFMNNFNGGGASNNANRSSVNLSFPKTDPRTFRYRSGVSYGPTFQTLMMPGSPNGQALDQDKSGGAPTNPGLLYSNRIAQTVADFDGVVRAGDGFLATTANPMSANTDARPLILNRPFRSVAEVGYAFRDAPWKSLDFFSDRSGDGGLLDLFCMEDTDVVAGKTSLNTRNPEVLEAILRGAVRDERLASSTIDDTQATTIASEVSTFSLSPQGPILNRANMPTFLGGTTLNSAFPAIKSEREAAVRALAPNTQTRTWNLLIDVIAEAGRFNQNATSLSAFTVEGSRRYWIHLAIDRFTGEVVDSQREVVYE